MAARAAINAYNNPPSTSTIVQDRLGMYVDLYRLQLASSESWSAFATAVRGRSTLSENLESFPHPAAPLLCEMRDLGVPVQCFGPEWSAERLEECLRRGSHKSASEYAEFVREEMADFCDMDYWVVLPYEDVQYLEWLRLSPLGVVPQRERRPRLIVDLTFWGVNDETISYVPKEAMQFGRSFERLIFNVRHANPSFGPVYLAKFDIANGFYRVPLDPETALALSVVLPRFHPSEPPLIAIPLVLPMGWTESPPSFCALTESITDVVNARMHLVSTDVHRLEEVITTEGDAAAALAAVESLELPCPSYQSQYQLPESAPAPNHFTSQPLAAPLAYTDVFVDDFISMVQGDEDRLQNVRRILLHTIDEALTSPLPHETNREEPVLVKKLRKGDGSWCTIKTVLGWILDTLNKTITLPPHRAARLLELFADLRDKKRVGLQKWQKFLGELRSMVLGIPGGKGLFSGLQYGLKYADKNRVRICKYVRDYLTVFEALAHSLASRPTRLAEIVPDDPVVVGACDAAKPGMGGVVFTVDHPPIVWRAPFPVHVQQQVVSTSNPNGKLTNSDLEQAGVLGQHCIICSNFDVRECTLATLCDNTPAVSRARKGSLTTKDCAAYMCLTCPGYLIRMVELPSVVK